MGFLSISESPNCVTGVTEHLGVVPEGVPVFLKEVPGLLEGFPRFMNWGLDFHLFSKFWGLFRVFRLFSRGSMGPWVS